MLLLLRQCRSSRADRLFLSIWRNELRAAMSIADLQVDSVREAFALQYGVSTAAVTFESEPLDECPCWDLTVRRLQATTSQMHK